VAREALGAFEIGLDGTRYEGQHEIAPDLGQSAG
jgi:hypothetical protein